MLALGSVSRSSVVTMTRCSMPASTRRATSSQQPVQTAWRESTMCLRGRARQYCRATRTKLVKSRLTPRVTRSLPRVATRRADFGQLRLETKFSVLERIRERVTKMKYSLVPLTTRAIRSSQAPKITLVVSGRTSDLSALGRKRMANQQRSNDEISNYHSSYLLR